jgi:hypothetical protein
LRFPKSTGAAAQIGAIVTVDSSRRDLSVGVTTWGVAPTIPSRFVYSTDSS